MIYIYQGDSKTLKAKKSLEEILEDLPKSMHSRALRYKQEVDAYNYVLGRLLLKKGLEDLGIGDQFVKIEFQKDGKPYLEKVFFNISHSENRVVCAISKESRIGIDIEKEKEIELGNFKPWFTKEEWKDINEADSPLQKFYWYWTRKESIIKALGVNLSYLHEIELNANQDFFIENEKTWYLKDLHFGSKYYGAICLEINSEIDFRKY